MYFLQTTWKYKLRVTTPHLDHGESALLYDVAPQPLEELRSGLRDMDAERLPRALHAGGGVDGVAEQAVPRHLETYYTRHAVTCATA